ncbi:ROK family protein [Paenibacillus sp. GSMTC-2017]|nr:ROK family protein [Paenibacillus sp. GSMTC-2017]MBH5320225.1 ROK family protein [Paenibacillus sp. GSMTC-2017]
MPSPKQLIYFYIAENGIISKAELLAHFEMTSSTMTRLLEEMVLERLILASGFGPSSGGRRPILYETNPEYGYFFGLEISRFYSTLGFFDVRMNPKSLTRWRMDEDMTPERVVDHVASSMRAILRDHRIDSSQVIGVGVGAVGPLDRERGIIVKPLYFPSQGWVNVPICRMLEERTGFTAHLENGANAALVGEQWAMRQSKPMHMMYVHAGVGLRSAIISSGLIVHGSKDMEGAIGQMIIQTDGPRLNEGGNFGALEAFVSVQALEKHAQAQAKMGRSGWLGEINFPPDRVRYDYLLQQLRGNNGHVEELFQKSASYLGIGLANMINMLHPEIVILGGALINSYDKFYETAIEIARNNIYYYPEYEPIFSKGDLREDAVATGAALSVWKAMRIE